MDTEGQRIEDRGAAIPAMQICDCLRRGIRVGIKILLEMRRAVERDHGHLVRRSADHGAEYRRKVAIVAKMRPSLSSGFNNYCERDRPHVNIRLHLQRLRNAVVRSEEHTSELQ